MADARTFDRGAGTFTLDVQCIGRALGGDAGDAHRIHHDTFTQSWFLG